MSPVESCDVCGADIRGEQAVRAELSFGEDSMCPSPFTMHKACAEKAQDLWKPDPNAICVNDPDFPETKKWTPDRLGG